MSADALDDSTVVPLRQEAGAAQAVTDEDTVAPRARHHDAEPETPEATVRSLPDDDTIASPSRAERDRRGIAQAERAAAVASEREGAARASAPRLRLPDGRLLYVDRPIVLGRSPRPPRISEQPEPLLIALASPSRELSSSHVELRPSGGAVVATDLHSANGTILVLPSGASRSLVVGDSSVVPTGTVIVLGEGNTLTVLAPLAAAATPGEAAVGEGRAS